MKILYCHDHRLQVYKNKHYSNGSFSKEFFNIYLSVFDELIFLSRQEKIERKPDNLTSVDGLGLEFKKVENLKKIKNWKYKDEIENTIKREIIQVDGVIARMPSSIGRMAIKYAREIGKPYLIEVVGCPWDASINHGSLAGKLLAPFSYISMKKNINESKRTSYITKSFLQTRYPTQGKEYIVPNVIIEKVSKNILEDKFKKIEMKRKEHVYVFGLIGSLDVGYKGHIEVLEAFYLIKKEYPKINFRLEFLGGGQGKKIKHKAKKLNLEKEVVFKGTLTSGDEVFKWIDSLDITLQPSRAEAQGRAIIEAMSRGNPVIASKVGGIIELIDYEWLIESRNYIQLKEKIMKMISDKDIMKEQSEKNFDEAKKYYKKEVETQRYNVLTDFKDDILK